ncbi:dTDP-4-dehydrorhamnose 3,5-epimerase family protein, partial [Bacteroides heparinolyticus]
PQSEASIRYNDETIGIEWPIAEELLILSEKDRHAVSFKDAVYYK